MIEKLKRLAETEERTVQSFVEEAVDDLLRKKFVETMRPRIEAAYLESLEQFGPLYKKLAELE